MLRSVSSISADSFPLFVVAVSLVLSGVIIIGAAILHSFTYREADED